MKKVDSLKKNKKNRVSFRVCGVIKRRNEEQKCACAYECGERIKVSYSGGKVLPHSGYCSSVSLLLRLSFLIRFPSEFSCSKVKEPHYRQVLDIYFQLLEQKTKKIDNFSGRMPKYVNNSSKESGCLYSRTLPHSNTRGRYHRFSFSQRENRNLAVT